ncbi:unnamed protein product [Cyprideis torosa]|uniref:Uncharacterized protein n=1 Tax=Cyprideis torosa TaxID=163714 RepID=A0A7R8ZMK7_9CRUS|nr:unnamed protein product [Cyprideis torosa]CAG0886019.1 unnamed protein product [Cyprideis torosa]
MQDDAIKTELGRVTDDSQLEHKSKEMWFAGHHIEVELTATLGALWWSAEGYAQEQTAVPPCALSQPPPDSFPSPRQISLAKKKYEELECLATWREGSLEYLMGRLKKSGSSFREDEDEFRCFVYEKGHGARSRGADILLAQSGDASCNGIYSAAEGPLVMKLSHKVKTKHQCHFPPWAVAHHKWHSLDWETVYQFTHGNSSVRITEKQYSGSRPPERLTCHAQWDRLTGTSSVDNNGGYVSTAFVVHALRECYGRYLCMVLHRRGANIMEVQFGESSMEEDMACTSLYFNKETAPYITLMVMNPSEIQCPTLGQWNIARDRSPFEVPGNSMACQSPRTLLVGCGGSSGVGLELQDKCASSKVSVTDTRTIRELAIPDAGSYTCHAYWEVNDTLFIVTSDENKPRDMTCFTLRTSSHASFSVLAMRHRESRQRRRGVGDSFFVDQPTVMLLAASERGCYRSTSSPEVVSFNATMMAYCGEHQSLTSSSAASSASLLSASLAVAFPVLLIQLLASCCRR